MVFVSDTAVVKMTVLLNICVSVLYNVKQNSLTDIKRVDTADKIRKRTQKLHLYCGNIFASSMSSLVSSIGMCYGFQLFQPDSCVKYLQLRIVCNPCHIYVTLAKT